MTLSKKVIGTKFIHIGTGDLGLITSLIYTYIPWQTKLGVFYILTADHYKKLFSCDYTFLDS